jgi:hypothetical protein
VYGFTIFTPRLINSFSGFFLLNISLRQWFDVFLSQPSSCWDYTITGITHQI